MNYVSELKRDQVLLEALDEYVDKESEVIIIDKVVNAMDLESLGFEIGKNDDSGRSKYDPRLYIYGYSNGIRSSRKLAKQAIINREVIWLIKGTQPKYRDMFSTHLAKGGAYQVEILKRNNKYYCHITFGMEKQDVVYTGHNGMIGIYIF